MTDDQLFLANALIDGELDAQQRELAEADPDVMREVAALRAQRTELRNVAPASDATRSAALAAAMDAWSPASETARDGSASSATVTPLQPRPSQRPSQHRSRWANANRLLGAAAAVVGIGLAGVVISRGLGNQGSDGAAPSMEKSLPIEPAVESARGSDMASAVVESPSSRSAAQADAGSASATEAAMSAMSSTALEYSLDAAMSADATELQIVPLLTLLFSEQDLENAVDVLLTAPSTSESSNANTAIADARACELPLSPGVKALGETTASNDDPERTMVRLIILTDDDAALAYAVDAETCLAVQSAPLHP